MKIIYLLLYVFCCLATPVWSQHPPSISGRWREPSKGTIIAISPSAEGKQSGTVVYSVNAKHIGLELFKNAFYDQREQVWKGTLVVPGDLMEISARLTVLNAQTLKVTLRKYIFTKTFTLYAHHF